MCTPPIDFAVNHSAVEASPYDRFGTKIYFGVKFHTFFPHNGWLIFGHIQTYISQNFDEIYARNWVPVVIPLNRNENAWDHNLLT